MDHTDIEVDLVPSQRDELLGTHACQQQQHSQPYVFICRGRLERGDLCIRELSRRQLRGLELDDIASSQRMRPPERGLASKECGLASEQCRRPKMLDLHWRRSGGAG